MRLAIVSDIHSNIEAFRSVLADIDSQGVEKIASLGDFIGFGPNPLECIDLLMELQRQGRLSFCLLGNNDQAVMFDPDDFNPLALKSIYYTREAIDESGVRSVVYWDFLASLQSVNNRLRRQDELLFAHGSPRQPLTEYLVAEIAEDAVATSALFKRISDFGAKYCFVGHTHVGGVFEASSEISCCDYYSESEITRSFGGRYTLGESNLIVNAGSVGQPRDGNPEACYAILNYEFGGTDNYVEFRRVKYDVEKTIAAFNRDFLVRYPDCGFLAERLRTGQ